MCEPRHNLCAISVSPVFKGAHKLERMGEVKTILRFLEADDFR